MVPRCCSCRLCPMFFLEMQLRGIIVQRILIPLSGGALPFRSKVEGVELALASFRPSGCTFVLLAAAACRENLLGYLRLSPSCIASRFEATKNEPSAQSMAFQLWVPLDRGPGTPCLGVVDHVRDQDVPRWRSAQSLPCHAPPCKDAPSASTPSVLECMVGGRSSSFPDSRGMNALFLCPRSDGYAHVVKDRIDVQPAMPPHSWAVSAVGIRECLRNQQKPARR